MKAVEGKHVYDQLFRSATSACANFEESHAAESRRDFIHKRQLCLKELREVLFWAKLTSKASLLNPNKKELVFLIQESTELIKIVSKGLATVRSQSGEV